MPQDKLFDDTNFAEEDDDSVTFRDIFDSKITISVCPIDKENPKIVEDIKTGKVYEVEEPVIGIFKLKGTNFKRDTRDFTRRRKAPQPPSYYSKLNILPEKITYGKEDEKKGQTYFA